MPRGQVTETINLPSTPKLDEFSPVQGSYNIPSEFMSESKVLSQPTGQVPTKDRILNSKLPDEIKRLTLEHPIAQQQMSGPTLSNELVEAASRLMKKDASGNIKQQPKTSQPVLPSQSINVSEIQQIVRETVENVLRENGLMVESTNKTNETIKFQVGEHIFEGKITKIKKLKR